MPNSKYILLISAENAILLSMTAAKLAENNPPKGSQITLPSIEDDSIINFIKSIGFWFKCADFVFLLGVFILSFPFKGGRSHILVQP